MIAFILTIRKLKTQIPSHYSLKDFHGDLKFSVCFRDAEVKRGYHTCYADIYIFKELQMKLL